MSISEKLKKAHKTAKPAIMTGILAMAVVIASLKGQAAGMGGEKTPVQAAELKSTQKQRQKMFEAAVRANLPKEEIAKYVDFPEFIPVDKNGQLDEKQAEDMIKGVVTNHIDAVKKFYKEIAYTYSSGGYAAGGNMGLNIPGHRDIETFHKGLATFFSEITGDKKNSSEFLKKVAEAKGGCWSEVAQRANSQLVHTWHWQDTVSLLLGVFACSLAGVGLIGILVGVDEKDKKVTRASALLTVLGIAATIGATKIENPNSVQGSSDPTAIVTFLKEGAQYVHDTYLTRVIQTEKDRQKAVAKEQFYLQKKVFLSIQK